MKVLLPLIKNLRFEVQLREVQEAGAKGLRDRGMDEDKIAMHGFANKIYVAVPEAHEIKKPTTATAAAYSITVETLMHPVPDPAHLGKRAGRAVNKAGQPSDEKGKPTGPPKPSLFRANDLAKVALGGVGLFMLELVMLTTGMGLDKQSELVQTAIFQNLVFREAVKGGMGPGPALMLEVVGDVLIAMTRSRLSQMWRVRALERFSDFFFMAMPESFFSRGEAPARMLGMSTKILIDLKQLVDNTLTMLVLYPEMGRIILSKLSSYACEKLWSQLVGMAGYKPNSHLLAAFLRKSIQKVQLLLDEDLPFCTAIVRPDRQYYAGGSVGSVKITFNDGSRLNPQTGMLDMEGFAKTGGKEQKRRAALTPKAWTPREFAKRAAPRKGDADGGVAWAKGEGEIVEDPPSNAPPVVDWRTKGSMVEVLSDGEWWEARIKSATKKETSVVYMEMFGLESTDTETILVSADRVRPPQTEAEELAQAAKK